MMWSFWRNKETLAIGTDIIEAFDQTDVLNKAATIYMTSKNMSFESDGMTPAAMQEVRDVFNFPDER